MERKSEEEEQSAAKDKAWYARVAAWLAAKDADERRIWGDTDEMMLARYEAGKCTEEEKARVEQAMRDFPAVRESMEISRELSAEWDKNAAIDNPQKKRPGEKTWTDRADPHEAGPRKTSR